MARLMRTEASSAELPLVDLPPLQSKRTAALRNLLMLLRTRHELPLPALIDTYYPLPPLSNPHRSYRTPV